MSTPFKPYVPKIGDTIYVELFGLMHQPVESEILWFGGSFMIVKCGLNSEEVINMRGDRIFDDTLEGFWRKCLQRSGEKILGLRKDVEHYEAKHKLLENLWLEEYDKAPGLNKGKE